MTIKEMLWLLQEVEGFVETMVGTDPDAEDALDDLREVIFEVAAASAWIDSLTEGATVN